MKLLQYFSLYSTSPFILMKTLYIIKKNFILLLLLLKLHFFVFFVSFVVFKISIYNFSLFLFYLY